MRVVVGTPAAANSRLDELTAREGQVLALLAQGMTDRAISENLWLTPKTVETHVRHILAKLNLPTGAHHNRRVLAVLTYLGESADQPAITDSSDQPDVPEVLAPDRSTSTPSAAPGPSLAREGVVGPEQLNV